jgi:hypothetical protein
MENVWRTVKGQGVARRWPLGLLRWKAVVHDGECDDTIAPVADASRPKADFELSTESMLSACVAVGPQDLTQACGTDPQLSANDRGKFVGLAI